MRKEIATLKRLRVERDLTYEELSAEIGIPVRTIHGVCSPKVKRPHERTLYKIRRWIETVTQNGDAA